MKTEDIFNIGSWFHIYLSAGLRKHPRKYGNTIEKATTILLSLSRPLGLKTNKILPKPDVIEAQDFGLWRTMYYDIEKTHGERLANIFLLGFSSAALVESKGDESFRQHFLDVARSVGVSDQEAEVLVENPEPLINNAERFLQDQQSSTKQRPKRRIFISHGRSSDWREVQAFLEKDLNILTLELAQQPNKGRTVLQKLVEESDKCSYAVVVMTGEDQSVEEEWRVRENVMHEIGFFQGKFGVERMCLLHQEDTNIPTNIKGLVYIPFSRGRVSATFGALHRELKTAFENKERG